MKVKFLVILILSLLIVNNVSANTDKDTPNYPFINSTSEFYPLKRIWEKTLSFVIFLKGPRFNHESNLLKTRLAELKYVADKKILSGIETSSNRFTSQAGILIEKTKEINDKQKTEKVMADFTQYSRILAELRDIYEANSSYWRLIQQDIDTLKILSDKIEENK